MASVLDWVNQALSTYKVKEAKMACNEAEIKKFVDAYGEALQVLTNNGKDAPSSTWTKEAQEIKELALEQAKEASGPAWECYVAKRDAIASKRYKNETRRELMGNKIQSALAGLWQKIVWSKQEKEDTPMTTNAKQTNNNGNGSSMREKYRMTAEMCDWVPADNVLMLWADCTSSGIRQARYALQEEGYKFERASASEYNEGRNTKHGIWEVVRRPKPEPEPEPEPEPNLTPEEIKVLRGLLSKLS